jgi:hypothetical protein
MFPPPQPEAIGPQACPWRLRAVRALALCSLLAMLVPCCTALFEIQPRFGILLLILFCPLWLPYVWLIWALRSNADARANKKALAVTIGFASLILILFSYVLVEISFRAGGEPVFFFSLVALLQIALLVGAITTYYSMERQPGDLQILTAQVWIPFLGIMVAAIVLPHLIHQEDPRYEASAVASLRTISKAQFEYARIHPDKRFASSLAELAPNSADALIDEVLAKGRRNGYVFLLIAAPSDRSGHITHYTVTARPQKYGKYGKRSFFTDESEVIRFTAEDRAPTAQDHAL